ncbi:Uncharacterised protein [Bordetella pertussis]|nr:Uncharacterised protein [Bordetella pertussis]CFW36828.1 Uncharacterised protein [Bordetella pertussis]
MRKPRNTDRARPNSEKGTALRWPGANHWRACSHATTQDNATMTATLAAMCGMTEPRKMNSRPQAVGRGRTIMTIWLQRNFGNHNYSL